MARKESEDLIYGWFSLTMKGILLRPKRLPDEVNSGDDDINPVWDAEEEVLISHQNDLVLSVGLTVSVVLGMGRLGRLPCHRSFVQFG